MFGSTPKDNTEEAKKAAIEQAKHVYGVEVHRMHEASPAEAESIGKRVKDMCGKDKIVPMEFKQKVLAKAREYERNANMRATDKLLHEASRLATAEHMKERTQKLGEARRYFSKACTLGADEEFRKAAQRLMETIMLTGGVHHDGPSRAKPLDIAPKTPDRAKS